MFQHPLGVVEDLLGTSAPWQLRTPPVGAYPVLAALISSLKSSTSLGVYCNLEWCASTNDH